MADGFNAIAQTNGITWSVTKIGFIMYVGGATSIDRPTVVVSLYDKWVPGGISGARMAFFDQLAGERTFTWGAITRPLGSQRM